MTHYQSVIEKYAQDLSSETITPGSQTDSTTMDPAQLQPGQPVYSPEGKEFVVLNNPAGESQKVIMPSDQQGSQLPQGVTTVEDTELSSEYTLTSPTTETKLQAGREEPYGGPCPVCGTSYIASCRCPSWMHNLDAVKNGHGRTCANGHRVGNGVAVDAKGNVVAFKKKADIKADLPEDYVPKGGPNDKKRDTSGLRIGQEGFTEIMNSIEAMVDAGYNTVDVVLNIGEMYPRDIGERVLAEARQRGIL
jgi:hypothetical protein